MGTIARPEDVKEGKKNASMLLTSLLLDRSRPKGGEGGKRGKGGKGGKGGEGIRAQELQETYRIADDHKSSAMGDYWLKLTRGKKSLGDEKLARVAHQAFLLGQITAEDFVPFEFVDGGMRLLQIIGNLLIESHGGATLGEQAVSANLAAWEAERLQLNDRRSQQRKDLRDRLKDANTKLCSAWSAVDELIDEMKASHQFEIPFRPADALPGSLDEEPCVGPVGQFIDIVRTLRVSLAQACPAISSVHVTEKDSCGFADLPRIEPIGTLVSRSLESIHDPLLRAWEKNWADDDEAVEIVVEDVDDCLQIQPSGREVRLC